MSLLEAIAARRSIAMVLVDKPVEHSLIEQIIEAGAWAPTHKRTEPWRFVVFQEAGRAMLEAAMVADGGDKLVGKAHRAPVVIAVWAAVGRGVKNPPVWEDHAATAACVQNMLLAAHALGLAAIWRSGSVVDMPAVQALMHSTDDAFTAEKEDRIVGFVYVGYPDPEALPPMRMPPKLADKIRWEE